MGEWSREELADQYRVEAVMEGCIAAVHLENYEDKLFWNTVLKSCHSGEYHYVAYSKSKKGNDTAGKNECLSFAGHLDKHFFVCVDSDTDSLNSGMQSKADKYILQTYSYSWENHVCHAEELQRRYLEKNDTPKRDFNFLNFLNGYSMVVMQGVALMAIDSAMVVNVSEIMDTQCTGDEMVNSGEFYLKRIGSALSQLFASIDGHTAETTLDKLNSYGINDTNAYMFSRGHNLYDIIVYIGKRCCSKKGLSFERDILLKGFPVSGYREIEAIRNDVNVILN